MTSARWKINHEQWESIKKAAIKYAAPLLLAFLVSLQQGRPMDEALAYVYAAALTMSINILSKLVTETK